ncbi:MetQ/NlpA family ABC transporter substrate-binding protein, partial [Streptomyces sp. NPDC056730]|uniref:MetQ/NlpA family ABC transporter substrate-binding protein n=1 Tax=Streptomyces sp. NPDC056730 TaxID=3345929 RepID=UPI0036B9F9B1
MRTTIKFSAAAAATAALALGLSACGTSSDPGASSAAGASADTSEPLVVAASPTPHADILNFVKKNLADKEGLKLEVKEFTDYVLPNTATQSGEVDANFFQHKPYLDDFNKKKGTDIVPVVNVELEPLGLYSKKVKDLKELKSGQSVALPNDTTNEGRALKLLADNGLITLKA